MNGFVSTSIQVAFSVLGLLVGVVVLTLALISIQAMSGAEPFREPLIFLTASFAFAFGLGAVCVLPLTGRFRMWPSAVAFATGGAIAGGLLASALKLITVFDTRLRALTDGGPLGIFVMAAVVGALAVAIAVGMWLLRTMSGRVSAVSAEQDGERLH